MTKVSMPLEALFEKGERVDFLRQRVAFMAELLMEADAEGLCGSGHGERQGLPHTSTDTAACARRS